MGQERGTVPNTQSPEIETNICSLMFVGCPWYSKHSAGHRDTTVKKAGTGPTLPEGKTKREK